MMRSWLCPINLYGMPLARSTHHTTSPAGLCGWRGLPRTGGDGWGGDGWDGWMDGMDGGDGWMETWDRSMQGRARVRDGRRFADLRLRDVCYRLMIVRMVACIVHHQQSNNQPTNHTHSLTHSPLASSLCSHSSLLLTMNAQAVTHSLTDPLNE